MSLNRKFGGKMPRSLFPLTALAILLMATGCTRTEPPRFLLDMEGRPNPDFMKTADERKAERDREHTITNLLTAAFGTPDNPYVFSETGLDLAKIQRAAGPSYSDEHGYQQGVYRKQCAHCHGVTGDGAGPTAIFLNPYPRDYRQGKYKFTSTNATTPKPTRADLVRTLKEGLMGSAMPSFLLLPDHEIDALVEYVKYLSIRGETEIFLNALYDQEEELPKDRAGLLEQVMSVVELWNAAEEAVLIPGQEHIPPWDPASDKEGYLASVERGKILFRDGKTANCIKCHGPNGLGDGGGEDLYDDWNKEKVAKKPPETYWQLPIQQLKPRNLRLGIYRNGRRPVDIYRKINAGIKGTPMPAAGNVLKEEQIWDVVNYVLSLPYADNSEPAMGEGRLVHSGL